MGDHPVAAAGNRSRITHTRAPAPSGCRRPTAIVTHHRPLTTRGSASVKASYLLVAAIGYVLGARAGRQRYESLVSAARRITGSQTVQSTAGVVQARIDRHVRQGKPPAR